MANTQHTKVTAGVGAPELADLSVGDAVIDQHQWPTRRSSSQPPGATIDEATLTKLIRDYAGPLHRYVTRLTFHDAQLAEDIVQETFLKLWQRPDVINNRYATIGPWLFTVARNLVNDHKRRRMARATEVNDAELTTIPDWRDPIGDNLQTQTIWQTVALLRPQHQAVLLLIYHHDRSPQDAAQRLGIPVGTVKSRTHHALRSLRTMFNQPCPSGGPGDASPPQRCRR
jgi:RNA polymerase sigma-70 factor (ECF subfamily)